MIDLFLAEETGTTQIKKEEYGKETQKKKDGGHEQKQSVGEGKRQRQIGRKSINAVQYSTRRKIMWRENRHWKRPKKEEEKEVRTWQGRQATSTKAVDFLFYLLENCCQNKIIHALITVTIAKYVDNVKVKRRLPKNVALAGCQAPGKLTGEQSSSFPEGEWKLSRATWVESLESFFLTCGEGRAEWVIKTPCCLFPSHSRFN